MCKSIAMLPCYRWTEPVFAALHQTNDRCAPMRRIVILHNDYRRPAPSHEALEVEGTSRVDHAEGIHADHLHGLAVQSPTIAIFHAASIAAVTLCASAFEICHLGFISANSFM